MKYAIYRAEKIFFTDSGKGRVVVLLHGFLGSSALWKQIRTDLSRSYRVIAIDLPGHGSTNCIGYAHSMEMMARAVNAVMCSLKLKRFVLVGHSMGGYVALAFADLFPDALRGLCLFHSTAYPDSEDKKRDRIRAIRMVKENKTLYTKETIRDLFARKNLKYLKEEISFAAAIARKTSRQGIIASLHGMRDRPARDIILGLVDYPIMMVIGEQDSVLDPRTLLEQAAMIRHPTVLMLAHDGHFGFLESPRRSARELRKFLRKCF